MNGFMKPVNYPHKSGNVRKIISAMLSANQLRDSSFIQINNMDLDLSKRTAIVCGSTQGLGYASAVELALIGCNVILMARNKEKLETVVSTLDVSKGQQHNILVADFIDTEAVKAAVDGLVNTLEVHILVNNTGGPAGGAALTAKPEEFLSAFNSHLINNHNLVQAVVPGMKAAGFGRIINIISTSVKNPIAGLGVSNTIRAAVANWAKTLATELGPFGITVNNVLPGFTKTVRADYVIASKAKATGTTEEEVLKALVAEIPAGRIGQPEEFGAAVAFLCSPAAAYINGINLPVDGGRLGCL
jgi:3-oxoacyl-[acyl-carrier protein] reductase